MSKKAPTVVEFFKRFPDDEVCLEHLWQTRCGDKTKCEKCGAVGQFKRLAKLPAWTCNCGHHIHPMVGTPFAKSRTPLQKWFYAIYLFTTSRHGVPAKELQRQLSVTYKTAWRMGHEIRKYMAAVNGDDALDGTVEVDETYVGGFQKARRGSQKGKLTEKTAVVGMVTRGGDVIAKAMPNARKQTVLPIVTENVEKGATVYTDENRIYHALTERGYDHDTIEHGVEEWVRGPVHTNTIEGYWSRFKNSFRGTHVHVSKKHMQKYLGEFEFRFNLRKQPHVMFDRLLASF